MDMILSFDEFDVATESFDFKNAWNSLKTMVVEFVKAQFEKIMSFKRKFTIKLSKPAFMKKRVAEDVEDFTDATFEYAGELENIAKDIAKKSNGVEVTGNVMRAQEIGAEINQNANGIKDCIQNDNNYVEESKNSDPTTVKREQLKQLNTGKITKACNAISQALTTFANSATKFLDRFKPNGNEVETQHKPRLIKALMLALAAAVSLIGVFALSARFA